MTIEQLANALGLWPGTQWLLTAFPHWLLPFVPLLATLGLWLVLKVGVERQRPQLGKQYKGLWPGDLSLSFSLGTLILGLTYVKAADISGLWRSPLWNGTTLLAVIIGVGFLAVFEYIPAIQKSSNPRTYTLYQLHTPTCLGHRVSMAVMIYLYMKVGIPALFTGAVYWPFRVFALMTLLFWAYCVLLDNTRPRPRDLGAIHPFSGAWFGIGRRRPLLTAAPTRGYDDLADTRFDRPFPTDAPRRTSNWDTPKWDEPSWADRDDTLLPGDFTWRRRDEPRTGTVYGDRPRPDADVIDADPVVAPAEAPRLRVNLGTPPAAPQQPRRTRGYDNVSSDGDMPRPAPRKKGRGYDSIK